MQNRVLLFRQLVDGLIKTTKVEIVTTNHTYVSVSGIPVKYGELQVDRLHLCSLTNDRPTHFLENLPYFVETGDWEQVQFLLPCFTAEEIHAHFAELCAALHSIDFLPMPEVHRKRLAKEISQAAVLLDCVQTAKEWWKDQIKVLLALMESHGEIWLTDRPKFADDYCTIDGISWPCQVNQGDKDADYLVVNTGDEEYFVFLDHASAGKAAKEYYQDLAQNDVDEFVNLVGQDTLVNWALGKDGGPGATKVKNLDAWLNLWLKTPEEHWASYDSKERDFLFCPKLAEDWGNCQVAYRTR